MILACSDLANESNVSDAGSEGGAITTTDGGADGAGDRADAHANGTDAQSPPDANVDAPPSSGDASTDSFPDPSTFACNLIIGVSVTADWFAADFEKGLDGDRWEAKTQSLAFVEQWADPANAAWSQALTSSCTSGAGDPDRVIFTGVNWTFTGEPDWETQLTKVVETLKGKYPGIREIDLMTMLRAPGNKVCGNPGSPEQVVQPFIDQAIAAVVTKYPSLVRAAPPFYAPSCAVFLPNSPHFADGGAALVANVIRDYYGTH